jgi:competence CoiA-like predicted nuclease
MLIARNSEGILTQPMPREMGACPGCSGRVVARCGDIKVWHWAHAGAVDCDPWHEGESPWHVGWKRVALNHGGRVEVGMGPHRADIVAADGTVCELQHSSLSLGEALEREAFYGRMFWILDSQEFRDRLHFRSGGSQWRGFSWAYPWQWPREMSSPVLFDCGGTVFIIDAFDDGGDGGLGHFVGWSDFVKTAFVAPGPLRRPGDGPQEG